MLNRVKTAPFEITYLSEIPDRHSSEYRQALQRYQYKTLWTYSVNCILGLWLLTSPFLIHHRSPQLRFSDVVSGGLVILFEVSSFSVRRYRLRWLTVAVAVWLLFAPLIFWSPSPAIYLNDTLAACFLITFSLLVPGPPGRTELERVGPDQPVNWSYNPSSWIRRWLGIALALFGFFISRYLAASQLGYVPHAWDPFFGNSTDRVLHSTVSRSFPISDAGFGSVAYMLEVLAGYMGDRARWRTSPWVVMTFAVLVVPLGVTSILLVILQPVVVKAWCSLCLIAAVALLTSVPLAVHEIIAMGLFLVQAKEQGLPPWKVFWRGGTISGAGTQDPDRTDYSLGRRWIASVQGVTLPWPIIIQLAIGAWLMARPSILPFDVFSANFDHIAGALIVTVAAVASAEVTRAARFINVLIGVILIVSSIPLGSGGAAAEFWIELISGTVLALASLPRGDIFERYGRWDKYVK